MSLRTQFRWWHELTLCLLLVCLLLIASRLIPNFTSLNSQRILSRQIWETAILSLGMTWIVVTGGIDLSVGSAMALCAVAFGTTFQRTQSLTLSCLASLVTGALGGLLNGTLVARLKVHPLIITLATYAAYRGIAEGVSQGAVYSRFGDELRQLSYGHAIPASGCIFFLLALIFGIVLAKTPFGRQLYAMGHNEQAARFSGVPVERIKVAIYTTSGVLAGLATLVYISRFDTAKADTGNGIELEVITAVVIGGTSIFGGRGNIVGTLLGLALIHETKLFVGRYWQIDELKSIFVGGLLIGSILLLQAISTRNREIDH